MQPSCRILDLVFPCFSLKREMRVVGQDFGLQPVTIAMAFVYFEKLVLQGRLNKQNRYVGVLTDATTALTRGTRVDSAKAKNAS